MHWNFRTKQMEPGVPMDWADCLPQDEKTQITYLAMIELGWKPMDAARWILEEHCGVPHTKGDEE